MGIWHTEQSYPDLSVVKGIKMSEEQLRFANNEGWNPDTDMDAFDNR